MDSLAQLATAVAGLYPKVHSLIGERCGNAGTGGGRDATVSVPIRLDVLAFVAEHYDDSRGDTQPGITLTVIECEQLCRADLGRQVILRSRPAGWDGLSPDPRVGAALAWIAMVANDLNDRTAFTVADHLRRLEFRANGMLRLVEPVILRDVCPHCAQATFIADADRAVCVNARCRDELDGRRCWLWTVFDDGSADWQLVPEPAVNERGRTLKRPHDLALLEQVVRNGVEAA